MALVINDRVKVNSTATGNSQTTFAIDNTPVTGFETFNTGIGVGIQHTIVSLIKVQVSLKLV